MLAAAQHALPVIAVLVVLALVHRPLGDFMARAYSSSRHLRIERGIYRLIGAAPDAEQTWPAYLRSVLMFSGAGVLLVYALQRAQAVLPYSLGLGAPSPALSLNTAVSFVTNTNWQSYSPELTLGFTVQALGLAVQNFLSAAVGLAVAIALVRAFAARATGTIGNFWIDLVRGTLRILLPIALLAGLVLAIGGVVQNLAPPVEATTLAGTAQSIPGGPVASQEAIKLLGTNGGGFFNANSAHPFENPSAWTSTFEVLLMLLIPFSLPRTLGRLVGDVREGRTVLAVMAVLSAGSFAALTALESAGLGTAPQLAGAAMEGKEQRFGVLGSTLFSTASTGTSTGAVNAMHDSYTALGGMVPMLNMMLGEVAPGGVGSGLYGMLVLAILSVFVGGLLIGRTPEYLGKRIGPREVSLAVLCILVPPSLVLVGTSLSLALPGVRQNVVGESLSNPGYHGLSELLYAFTSAANNNGSAFGGLTADTPWMNLALASAMLLGRFVPIVLVLALAGSLAAQRRVPTAPGTLPTRGPLFATLLLAITVLVTALTFVPVLALGPLAEGLM
ncbi:potassium-transporting ATPase subunit KdpA [Brachybacterium kimchii]|uniref:Potassium-transporting ATPase potassium-binding subunit n=1 Tax=Brachybacterium kimchii TaxID=2942909 RepID=A0ABY4NC53_9MICO|nr:potassium-transporting ATPase subunit KdpA [Brachybacterium kimchii]UQN31741.1 potassium-transporting ATPase subunit KdpA [Brachybacterium kimchii]